MGVTPLCHHVVGRGELAPRGVPVGHTDVELRREDWYPPVTVELEGLEVALPLFGLSSS